MSDINIPTSMCKKFLISQGKRAKPTAVEVFKKELESWALKRAEEVSEVCESNKRKTISPEDFEKDEAEDEVEED